MTQLIHTVWEVGSDVEIQLPGHTGKSVFASIEAPGYFCGGGVALVRRRAPDDDCVRLVKAAPRMLAALERAVVESETDGDFWRLPLNVQDEIQTAIAEARGERDAP